MSELILKSSSLAVPQPREAINVRMATMYDMTFIDGLQKKHSNNLGFLQFAALEGKIVADQILIAEANGVPVGYCIGQDRYYKRDDVGIIYQMNIVPGKQRGFVATTLLKAQFDRSAYGCRLYCCWCAQDLEANHFWESMGFVPLAFRNGSEKKDRVHIFWEKKIRGKDDAVNWWFPHKTDQGAMRADRLAFPIPPGVHWRDVRPARIPSGENQLTDQSTKRVKTPKVKPIIDHQPQWGPPDLVETPPIKEAPVVEKPKRVPKPKIKLDPKFVSAARELRDRYLEEVNERGFKLEAAGKYDLTRQIEQGNVRSAPLLAA